MEIRVQRGVSTTFQHLVTGSEGFLKPLFRWPGLNSAALDEELEKKKEDAAKAYLEVGGIHRDLSIFRQISLVHESMHQASFT